jgi:hypothetical protein
MRLILLGLVVSAACSKRAPEPPPPERTETVRLPGHGAERSVAASSDGLSADEGMFEITPIRNASVGRAQTARIRIVPGAGFHINTEYPFVVQLADAPGLKLEKLRFEGGRRGTVGDAETLVEQELAIPITVTPTTSGEHTLNGTINFGICKATACLQRSMPITLAIAAT